MTQWFSKNLGDGMLAWQPVEETRERFTAAYRGAGEPADMAVFKRHESEGRLHCQVMLYFSPGAADFARSVGAEPCRRPAIGELELLAGSGNWRGLFPDEA